MEIAKTKKRCEGCGRPPSLEGLEHILFDRIVEMRTRKMKVSRSLVRCLGSALADEKGLKEFKSSNSWCALFMKRFKLSLRRATNLTTLTDEMLIERCVSYMKFLQQTLQSIDLSRTLLMDEIAIYFEDCRMQTIDFEGRRHVIIKSIGFSSMRITACVGVWANGEKNPPLLIHKGKDNGYEISRKTGPILATVQKSAWVNGDLLIKWIDAVFPLIDLRPGKCLVWDSCRAHVSKKVKNHCRIRNIKMVTIPGGCTPYLQAGHIGIFRILKDKLSEIINQWKISDQVEYTRHGNPKAPSPEIVETWFRDAWSTVQDVNIKKSINAAGFNTSARHWHISKHDVYGEKFLEAWDKAVKEEEAESQTILDIIDEMDDIVIDDE